MDWMFDHGGVTPQEPQFDLGPDPTGFLSEAAASETRAEFDGSPEPPIMTEGVDDLIIIDDDWMDGFVTNSTDGDGGDTVDDVVVIGIRDRDNPEIWNPHGRPVPGNGGGMGGNGGGSGQQDCGCPSTGGTPAQQADARARAADGAAIVLGQNWENQEYGGFIYRDNATGQLVMGTITGSAIGTWSPTADNMAGISSYGQIVGIVHSHGPNVVGSFHNYPSTGDWSAFDSLVSMGATNLSAYYIVGADGQLREYESNDRDHETPGEVVSGC